MKLEKRGRALSRVWLLRRAETNPECVVNCFSSITNTHLIEPGDD